MLRKICVFLNILFISSVMSLSAGQIDDIIDNYIRFNKWEEAATALRGYTTTNPQDQYGFVLLSGVYNQLGRYELAIAMINQAIELETLTVKRGEYYFNLAIYYYNLNDSDKALEALTRSITLNPALDGSYYMIGAIKYKQGNIPDTITNWRRFISLTENTAKREQVARAIAMLEEAEILRVAQEEQARRLAEQQRLQAEEAQRLAEQQRLQAEEQARRLAEQQRIQAEEQTRLLAEQQRIQAEERAQREAFIQSLMTDIQATTSDATGFEEFKVNRTQTTDPLDELD